jgi:hypothetical protein
MSIRKLPVLSKLSAAPLMLLLVAVIATGCGTTPAPAATPAAAPLTLKAIQNAQYQGIYTEPVRLTGGQYQGPPFVEGGASRPTVTYIEPHALGDLNGDGLADAAVLLVENSGGSGAFVYRAAVLDEKGSPDNVATTLLGDRVKVETLAIADGQIAVHLVSYGPDDPMCCPTQQEDRTYILQDGQLVQTSSQILGTAEPPVGSPQP